jgi:hypothetical protein
MTYKVQINDEVRDATSSEAADIEAAHADALARKQAEADKLSVAASGRAKLAALGLTDAEIVALLGA